MIDNYLVIRDILSFFPIEFPSSLEKKSRPFEADDMAGKSKHKRRFKKRCHFLPETLSETKNTVKTLLCQYETSTHLPISSVFYKSI